MFCATFAVWLLLCWGFWKLLIQQAATSGDLYSGTPSFQLLNFVVQYLWFFLLLLAVVLLLEWVVLWAVGSFVSGHRRRRGEST